MYFEQFYLGCLAHASYMLGAAGEALVVDPQRDVDIYLKAAAEHHLSIRHIFETHLHADFVSGHKELADRTGAKIYIGRRAGAKFPHVDLHDGFSLRIEKVEIRALETPGHTPEGISLVVTNHEKSSRPWAVLTGDTLFIGDVGRPDLSTEHSAAELAGMLFDSLHNKLLSLPDEVLVYPAHGAGSLCGRNMRPERSSTIGTERLTNHALQIKTKAEFVRELTTNLPSRPDYFLQDAQINRQGASALADLSELVGFAPAALARLLNEGVVALDVRTPDEFAVEHVPGSMNIALSGQFASWAGTLLGIESMPVLIANSSEQISEARMRLARVGIELTRGYLDGGIDGWKRAGLQIASLPQITVEELHQQLEEGKVRVLDVRREGEYRTGHIAEAKWCPLDNFSSTLPQNEKDSPVAVHCKSGYRSMIACSLLQRAGFTHVINVVGGFDAWQSAKLPVEQERAEVVALR